MSGFKKPWDKCHCGSALQPLLQEYVCKAECDIPLSMRSRANQLLATRQFKNEPLRLGARVNVFSYDRYRGMVGKIVALEGMYVEGVYTLYKAQIVWENTGLLSEWISVDFICRVD